MKKVHFALHDEIKEDYGRGGIVAATRKDTDPTAAQSLEAIARRAGIVKPNDQTDALKLSLAFFNKLPSARFMRRLVKKASLAPVNYWLWSFTSEGRAAKIESDWQEAVEKAQETHAANEYMQFLKHVRERSDEETGTVVCSALGHRSPMDSRETTATPSSSAEPGQSSARGALTVPQMSAMEIAMPGFKYREPTAPHAELIYEPHFVLIKPVGANFREANKLNTKSITDATQISSHVDAGPEEQCTSDVYDPAIPSIAINRLKSFLRSDLSLDLADKLMEGDNENNVLFGRWKHPKDAPLSHIKGTIEQELHGPGAKSLYGPILDIADDPLVRQYNKRREQFLEDPDADESEAQPLSPITMKGCSASHRVLLRTKSDNEFSMENNGTFKVTGFQRRTNSIGSTLSSSPSGDMDDSSSFNEEVEAPMNNIEQGVRYDSAVHMYASAETDRQSDQSGDEPAKPSGYKLKMPADPHLPRYEILERYSRNHNADGDEAVLEVLKKDGHLPPRYQRNARDYETTAEHLVGGLPRAGNLTVPGPSAAFTSAAEEQQRTQESQTVFFGAQIPEHQNTPRPAQQESKFKMAVTPSETLIRRPALHTTERQPTLPIPIPYKIHTAHQARLALKRTRAELQQHNTRLRQEALATREVQAARPTQAIRHLQVRPRQETQATQQVQPAQAVQHPQTSLRRPDRLPNLRLQTFEVTQANHARPPLPVTERRSNLRFAERRVMIVKPEEVESAFVSDSEKESKSPKTLKFDKISPLNALSKSPKSNLSNSVSRDGAGPKLTLAVTKDSAPASHASNASAPIHTKAGSHSSTEPSPAHTTPATVGSSGSSKGKGKSPALAEHIAKRLAEHLSDSGSNDSKLPFAQDSATHLSDSEPSDSDVAACAEALLRIK